MNHPFLGGIGANLDFPNLSRSNTTCHLGSFLRGLKGFLAVRCR